MAKEFFKKLALGVAISLTSVAVLAGFSRLGAWLRPDEEVIECSHVGTVKLAVLAPTCTEDGLTDGLLCETCHGVIKKQEPIKSLGHLYTAFDDAPTCVEGRVDGSYCVRCGEVGTPYTSVPAVEAHSDNNSDGVCDGCGNTFTDGQFMLNKISFSDDVIETDFENDYSYSIGTVLRVYASAIETISFTIGYDMYAPTISIPDMSSDLFNYTLTYNVDDCTIKGDIVVNATNSYVDFYIGEFAVISNNGVTTYKKGDAVSISANNWEHASNIRIITINE